MSKFVCVLIRTKVEISVFCLTYCYRVTPGMDQGATLLHWGILRRNRMERGERTEVRVLTLVSHKVIFQGSVAVDSYDLNPLLVMLCVFPKP